MPVNSPPATVADELATEDPFASFRQQQRKDLAEALITLVAQRGFAGATVSDLVRATRMSRKTFYKYFTGIDAALVFAQEVVIAEMGDMTALRSGSGLDRFTDGLRRISAYALAHPERMAFLSFFDFAFKEHEVKESEQEAYETFTIELLGRTLTVFRQGQSDGSIDPNLPARDTALACTNAVFGLAQRAVNIPGIATDPALVERILDAEIRVWHDTLAAR